MKITTIGRKRLIKKTAKEIITIIENIYFGKDYISYRVDHGSNGAIKLIIQTIKDRYEIDEM